MLSSASILQRLLEAYRSFGYAVPVGRLAAVRYRSYYTGCLGAYRGSTEAVRGIQELRLRRDSEGLMYSYIHVFICS
jgi:hypothetical protein